MSITKSLQWRGALQEFSNVYHYRTEVGELFDDADVIAAVVAAERPVHGGQVNFVRARTWGPTDGTKEANLMREVVDLTGTGSGGDQSNYYRELAIMIEWPLGRYGRFNRPQRLRKWLHTQAPLSVVADYQEGHVPDRTMGATLQAYVDAVTTISVNVGAQQYELCTKTGRVPIGPAKRYPYLEHRQLGR